MDTMIKCATYAAVVVFSLISTTFFASALDEERKIYIVYMGEKPPGQFSTQEVHINILEEILENSSSRESLVYSYTRSLSGFAAKLTEKEAKKISGLESIVSIFPSETFRYHTTRSWDFLHFPLNITRNPTEESDMIIGVIDTGITPDSKSFADNGLGPPPAKWKGVCQKIKCNNKLIGARAYLNSSLIDEEGHDTHTASTAIGQNVESANLYGIGKGTTRGVVLSARIAAYKVCTPDCTSENILGAFDDAIADGVDVLSVSLGGGNNREYFEDPIATGAFHAMKNGVLTSVAGGNSGPARNTLSNVAPWMIVSAASNTDRSIVDKVVLGDGTTIVGTSVNTFTSQNPSSPLLYGNKSSIKSCFDVDQRAQGSIVVCSDASYYEMPLNHGAKGVVIVDNERLDTPILCSYPAVQVNSSEGEKIFSYTSKTEKPVANIHQSEGIVDSKAPIVASFSSRGPNTITPNILKPDISAPGIAILAAWPDTPLTAPDDGRRSKFNIISGTSMACPHVSGVGAYVKSFHSKWSSAMIMSALMTSATPMDPTEHGDDAELSYGVGQINPVNAINPGLVYDARVDDYIHMLCDQGYNINSIRLISGDSKTTCPDGEKGNAKDLNYPSMSILVDFNKSFKEVTFKRTVTNVGDANSVYTAKIVSDSKLKVTIEPQILSFSKLNEKRTFVVTVSGGPLKAASVASASVVWSDGKHDVRSPLVVYTV